MSFLDGFTFNPYHPCPGQEHQIFTSHFIYLDDRTVSLPTNKMHDRPHRCVGSGVDHQFPELANPGRIFAQSGLY